MALLFLLTLTFLVWLANGFLNISLLIPTVVVWRNSIYQIRLALVTPELFSHKLNSWGLQVGRGVFPLCTVHKLLYLREEGGGQKCVHPSVSSRACFSPGGGRKKVLLQSPRVWRLKSINNSEILSNYMAHCGLHLFNPACYFTTPLL